MAELRWILLIVGAVVIGGVYLWSKRQLDDDRPVNDSSQKRTEPSLDSSANSEMESTGPVAGAGRGSDQ